MDGTTAGRAPATAGPTGGRRGPVDPAEILGLVQQAPTGLTTADVAAKTGLRLSTVRTHLDHLVDAGLLVKARANSGLPYRPAWRYRPSGADPAPSIYQRLVAAALDDLAAAGDDTRADALRIGLDWGRQLADEAGEHDDARATLTAVLGALDFSPRETGPAGGADRAEIHLFTCPYLELVRRHPDAMCGLHAGVVQGVLERAGSADERVRLEPFGAPGACVVRFRAGGAGRG